MFIATALSDLPYSSTIPWEGVRRPTPFTQNDMSAEQGGDKAYIDLDGIISELKGEKYRLQPEL